VLITAVVSRARVSFGILVYRPHRQPFAPRPRSSVLRAHFA
jgi:hypothetical protein